MVVLGLNWLVQSPCLVKRALSSRRAESARAVTGRRCPHSRVGVDFLAHWPVFFSRKRNSIPKSQVIKRSFQ